MTTSRQVRVLLRWESTESPTLENPRPRNDSQRFFFQINSELWASTEIIYEESDSLSIGSKVFEKVFLLKSWGGFGGCNYVKSN